MSARDALDVLGGTPKYPDDSTTYDRATFLLLEAIVREIGQLRGEVEALRRTLDARTEAGV